MFFEVWLELAKSLCARWWTRPLGWLLYALFGGLVGALVLVCAAIPLSIVGGVLWAVGEGVATANPRSASLFLAAVGLAVVMGIASWRDDGGRPRWSTLALGAGGGAVVLALAWLVTIPGFWNFLDSSQATVTRDGRTCVAGYSACLSPNVSDYDCSGGSGDGPRYISGPVRVTGDDPFGLDRDRNGVGC